MSNEVLSEADLARLRVRLMAPLVVGDILEGFEPLDDVTEYALQEMVADMQPDAALLCLALCAQIIATHAGPLPIAQALTIEAEQIIADYGPVWRDLDDGSLSLDNRTLGDLLMNVPEDLEALGDLLFATGGALTSETKALAAILCDITGEMAYMHRDAAEYRIEDTLLPLFPSLMAAEMGENVIPFPQAQSRPAKS